MHEHNVENLKMKIMQALQKVQDPELGQSLVALNMVKDIQFSSSDRTAVIVTIELTTPACPLKNEIASNCERAILGVSGIHSVRIEFGARPSVKDNVVALPGISCVVAVGSGKGGVGKSTVCANLARSFVRRGMSVGLLDADVYGPNIPHLFNKKVTPNVTKEKKIVPIVAEGIQIVSMGLLTDAPLVWRGPMLHGVLKQFLHEVLWGELDVLFVDMPPGTGDVQISLCQTVPLTGALMVTTPQELSIADVRKAIGLFRKFQVDVLGIVENMSYYKNPETGETIYVFGEGGGLKLANEWRLPFFGCIPMEPSIPKDSRMGVSFMNDIVDALLPKLNGA